MARKPKKSKQAPISTHPVFPAIVALWFAALFGVGSLVLPAVLFEKLFAATGLASVSSAFAAPIASTARIAIAIVSALIGVALGIVLARKVAASHAEQTTPSTARNQAAREAKKPISAMEELGVEGLDEPIEEPAHEPIPGRRRALSVTDDSGPSDFLEYAPLPGGSEADMFGAEDESAVSDIEAQEDPLELGDYEEDDERGWGDENARLNSFGSGSLSSTLDLSAKPAERPDIMRQQDSEDVFDPARPFDHPTMAPETHPAPFAPPPAPKSDVVRSAASDLRPFDLPEATPAGAVASEVSDHEDRSASTDGSSGPEVAPEPALEEMRRRFDPPAVSESSDEDEQAPEPQEFAAPAQESHSRPAFGMPTPVEEKIVSAPTPNAPVKAQEVDQEEAEHLALAKPRVATASLSELGMVELVERFALSLQRKTNAPGSMTAAPALAAGLERLVTQSEIDEPEDTDSTAENVVPETPATASADEQQTEISEPPAPRVPAALQPIGLDEEDEEDGSVDESLSMPFQRPPAAQESPQPYGAETAEHLSDETDEGEDEGPVPSDGFASLLALKSPFSGGREFVRIDDQDDESDGEIEPVVVFPGNETRRAVPAADGPSRDPESAPRFEKKVDNGATEQALREALAKLQKLSGAA